MSEWLRGIVPVIGRWVGIEGGGNLEGKADSKVEERASAAFDSGQVAIHLLRGKLGPQEVARYVCSHACTRQ